MKEMYMRSRYFYTAGCVFASALFALSILSPSASYSQNMNYGALESLFDEPVTTSATGKPQRVSDVPVTMEILTADDIRRSGAKDIAEVLRQVNGVGVIQKSETMYDVSVRGYNQHLSNRLLVLVNGREVFVNFFGFTNWPLIPVQLEEIRQIEIVKGPNSALFGFNAVNGVVNIVTYNPLYDDESSAGVRVGTGDYRNAHYVQTMSFGSNAGVRLSAGGARMEGNDNSPNGIQILTNPGSGQSLIQSPEQGMLNVDGLFKPTENSNLRVELSASRSKQNDITPLGTIDRNDYLFQAARVNYDYDAGKWGLLKANLYRNYLEYTSLKSSNPLAGKIENELIVAQLEDTFKINENHAARVQFEYRGSSVMGVSPAALLPVGAEASHDVFSAAGAWQWAISPELSWMNAVRADHLKLDHNGVFSPTNSVFTVNDFDRDVTEFSYNSGLVWHPTQKDTFRLTTARGVEIPSLIEYAIDLNVAGGTNALGNPDLEASIITNYEVAWDRKINAINGAFRSSLFYQVSEDIKSIGVLSIAGDSVYGNLGDSETFGFELGLSGSLDQHYDWGVGYIFQKVDDDLQNGLSGSTLTVAKDFEETTPRHEINLKLGYENGPWEAETLVYYTSEYNSVFRDGANFTLEQVDGYVGANARVAYTLNDNVTFSVSGQQLQSSKTKTSAAPDVDRRVIFGVNYKF